jgi:DNA-binding transcriptional LysR family regulator
VELLIRGRRRDGVRLSSAGEALHYRVRLAMQQVGVALQEIEAIRGAATGKVILGTTDALAHDVFSQFLCDFNRQQPNVRIEMKILDRGQLIEALVENRVDIALGFDLPVRLGFRSLAEFQMKSSVVVRRDHPLSGKNSTTLGACAQFPLALPIEGDNLRGILEQMHAVSRIRPRVVLSVNSFVVMREMVAAGIAISIQTRLRGAFANRDPRLIYVPLKDAIARYSILACCAPVGRKLSPEAGLFASQLLEALQKELTEPDL